MSLLVDWSRLSKRSALREWFDWMLKINPMEDALITKQLEEGKRRRATKRRNKLRKRKRFISFVVGEGLDRHATARFGGKQKRKKQSMQGHQPFDAVKAEPRPLSFFLSTTKRANQSKVFSLCFRGRCSGCLHIRQWPMRTQFDCCSIVSDRVPHLAKTKEMLLLVLDEDLGVEQGQLHSLESLLQDRIEVDQIFRHVVVLEERKLGEKGIDDWPLVLGQNVAVLDGVQDSKGKVFHGLEVLPQFGGVLVLAWDLPSFDRDFSLQLSDGDPDHVIGIQHNVVDPVAESEVRIGIEGHRWVVVGGRVVVERRHSWRVLFVLFKKALVLLCLLCCLFVWMMDCVLCS